MVPLLIAAAVIALIVGMVVKTLKWLLILGLVLLVAGVALGATGDKPFWENGF